MDMEKLGLSNNVEYMRTVASNVILVGAAGGGDWVLVDAGMPGFAAAIAAKAAECFEGRPPCAIILTHGHFDHVGSLLGLLRRWDVPVYAHRRELPFLTGRADYPEGRPVCGDGLLARVSPRHPHKGVDLGERVLALPPDGSVPGLPEWRWIATPGHSRGHISLFREADRTLITGDAVITVKPAAAFKALAQEEEVHGPPEPFTDDGGRAEESVALLAELKPETMISGHGLPMEGEALREGLARLAAGYPATKRHPIP